MSLWLCSLIFISYLTHTTYCQGVSMITLSKTRVYLGEPITLTCSIAADSVALLSLTIDAFNETLNVGALFCSPVSGSTFRNTGEGRFQGYNFTGCDKPDVKNPSLSVSIVALPPWELDYRCTFLVYALSATSAQNVTSVSTRLTVLVLPETPSFTPSLMVFNESENAAISCNSRFGKPAAAINLTVVQQNGQRYELRNGTDTVSLMLPVPLSDWHGAAAICHVENHNVSDATTRTIVINYITARRDKPVELDTYLSSQMLNCSAEVSSYPGVSYNWSIPSEVIISELSSSSLSNPVFAVPQGRTGLFECTAINSVTLKTVRITFAVSCTIVATPWQVPAANSWIWAILAIGAAVVVLIVVFVVLHRLGRLRKVWKSCWLSPASLHRSQASKHRGRLMIAAEGVVTNLQLKILPTITLVEFPDRSCSLDDILDKVGEAISLSYRPAFVSVALLLRRSRSGLILCEKDQVMLTSESWTGAQGDKQHRFFTRLVEMSMDKRDGNNRIDLLNYGSKDAASLCLAMTDLLKTPVTVSKDRFGMEHSARHDVRKHSCVGEDYFSRASASKVVYAEVELTNSPASSRPRKADDRVVYSELVRKA